MEPELHVFLVISIDPSRVAKLHCICSTREIAEGYRVGIEDVIVDHLLAASMGIYTLPKFGTLMRGEGD